jgi:hypothetical protein
VTSPQDVIAVFKNPKALSFDPFIKNVMQVFGASPAAVEKMYQVDGTTPLHKSFMEVSHDNFKLQLHPGDKLDTLQARFLGRIDDWLRWDRLAAGGPMVLSSPGADGSGSGDGGGLRVSLLEWCKQVMLDTATRAFFGDAMFDVAPRLLDSFFAFDDDAWKLNYRFPRFAAKAMYAAKDSGEAAFARYFGLPKAQRPNAAWMTDMFEQGMRDLGIDEREMAAMLFLQYWV